MYESEDDEEELVGNIIKVYVTAKDGIKDIPQKVIRKSKLPEILVTDYSEYDIKDLFEEPIFTDKICVSDFQTSDTKKVTQFLNTGNEFESEPTDLMPESFLSFLSGCKNLIGDVSNYKEERITADDWIEHFDAKLKEAMEEERRLEEYERQKLIKQEERRRRLEERRKIRKINKPLINLPPRDLTLSSRSCHDNVCLQTLLEIKKNLKKYQPLIRSFRRSSSRYSSLQPLKSNLDIIKLLNQNFSDFIDMEMRKIINITDLRVDGILLLKKKDAHHENVGENHLEVKQENDELSLQDALNVSIKTQHPKKPKLKWKLNREFGVLYSKQSTYTKDLEMDKNLKNIEKIKDFSLKFKNENKKSFRSRKENKSEMKMFKKYKQNDNKTPGTKEKNEINEEIPDQRIKRAFKKVIHIHIFSQRRNWNTKTLKERKVLCLPVVVVVVVQLNTYQYIFLFLYRKKKR